MSTKKETEQEVEDQTTPEKKENKKKKTSKANQKLAELEQELSESKDKYLRLYAEFDNYKKRTTRERIEMMSSAGRDIIASLLPVLDDFERAQKSAEDETNEEVFPEGVSLVYSKLFGIMKNKGVTTMESTGQDFDPELHEAITEIPAPTEEMKGKIIDTIEQGYLLNDKIIRHAKVVVGK